MFTNAFVYKITKVKAITSLRWREGRLRSQVDNFCTHNLEDMLQISKQQTLQIILPEELS